MHTTSPKPNQLIIGNVNFDYIHPFPHPLPSASGNHQYILYFCELDFLKFHIKMKRDSYKSIVKKKKQKTNKKSQITQLKMGKGLKYTFFPKKLVKSPTNT